MKRQMQHTMNAITTTQNQIHQGIQQNRLVVTSATSGHLLKNICSSLCRFKRVRSTW